jgi:hypothetical protein
MKSSYGLTCRKTTQKITGCGHSPTEVVHPAAELRNVSRAPPGAQRTMIGFGAASNNSTRMIPNPGFTLARWLRGNEVLVNNTEFSEQPVHRVHVIAEHGACRPE